MASYTPNLDLLKKSPVTDGDDMFNVETMLNENWDRIDRGVGDYTTPAQKMGLTGDLSVGASLGVLANIGNVHVWRKTVTTDEGIPEVPEVPPSYELGEAQTQYFIRDKDRGKAITMLYSNSVSVSYDGRVSLVSPSSVVITTTNTTYPFTYVSGKFIQAQGGGTGVEPETTSIFYMKPSGVLQNSGESSSWDVYGTECQMVNGIAAVPGTPAVPPGTHITYLTSVNRNAYQEGDDAKEAGYVLGDMASGYLFASAWTGNASNYYYSETIKVSDTGTLTQENVKSYTANATNDSWVSNIQSAIRGKFITVSGEKDNGGSEGTNLVYIPDDAIVSYFENGVSLGYPYNYGFLVNKMQQVTGYPAIPAGTTIEYLGVLGDKVRMQMVSYVGTGTYGKDNPNSITADFKIKYAFLIATYTSTNLNFGSSIMVGDVLTTSYKEYVGFHGTSPTNSYGKKSIDEKTFYWYHATNATDQFNYTGGSYWILIIG